MYKKNENSCLKWYHTANSFHPSLFDVGGATFSDQSSLCCMLFRGHAHKSMRWRAVERFRMTQISDGFNIVYMLPFFRWIFETIKVLALNFTRKGTTFFFELYRALIERTSYSCILLLKLGNIQKLELIKKLKKNFFKKNLLDLLKSPS